jgi:hypothetical protein
MNIKSLEINVFKSSEIKDGDTILVKIDEKQKKDLKPEDIRHLYDEIKNITKKDVSIYFFPKYLSIDIIKKHVKNVEDNKEKFLQEQSDKNNEKEEK